MSDLFPSHVILPRDTIFEDGRYVGYWKYVVGTLEHLSDHITLEFSDELQRLCWSAFEMRVDGQTMVLDYSDFTQVSPLSSRHKHWLRLHHTTALAPFPHLGSFPPWSFLDWSDYEKQAAMAPYDASGDAIIYRHSRLENRQPNLVQRRIRAFEILKESCREYLNTGFIPQQQYFEDCRRSLAVVHIPGSHPHILDRSVQQMFALGVCVISPDLWTTCLEERPQANQHYVAVRDDFSDLPNKIRWVRENRQQAKRIGNAAQDFFASHCTPEKIWAYIKARLTD